MRFKAFWRLVSLVHMRQSIEREYLIHSRLMCVNGGDGLGLSARLQYKNMAKAYNKARHQVALSFLIRPVKPLPPKTLNQIRKEENE